MELRLNSNSGFAIRKLFLAGQASACPLGFIERDAVLKSRSEELGLNKGAQTSFFTGRLPAGSVPLKGETKSKRAGRMPALQR